MRNGAAPSISLAIAGSAAIIHLLPDLSAALVYDRGLVLSGELWRLFTAPLVHFSLGHLGWNVAVLVAAGWLGEGGGRGRYATVLALCALLHAFWLVFVERECLRFGGLSGAATGLLVWIALQEVRHGSARRVAGAALLLLTAGKLLAEGALPEPIFADLGTAVPAYSAHWIGALAGVLVFAAPRRGLP